VAKGICHNVGANLVVDSDGRLLNDYYVAIQIAELLCKKNVSSQWMFSMKAWHVA
jgi:hypothetical protein